MSNPIARRPSRVLANEPVSSTAFLLTLERAGLTFHAGELVGLQGPDKLATRDYTIASGEQDEHLQVLIRLIPHGALTPWLSSLRPGDGLDLTGPYGTFTLRNPGKPVVFLATGTGIAPGVAYRKTYPHLKLTVLHGVAVEEDLFFRSLFDADHYLPCVSREPCEGWQGRVTDRLAGLPLHPEADFYLCGANEMIYQASDLLRARGVGNHRIFHEPYYYRWDS
jgi:ferredoxin--NADP+ reductase/benzoate/toluate 1,2-dioxygenase reductase subunit